MLIGESGKGQREVQVLFKTAADFGALCARIVALHPYQVPEILKLDVAAGHAPYLDWVKAGSAR